MVSSQAIKNMQDPVLHCKVYSIRLRIYWFFSFTCVQTAATPTAMLQIPLYMSVQVKRGIQRYWTNQCIEFFLCGVIILCIFCVMQKSDFTFHFLLFYFKTVFLHTHVGFWNFPCTKILGTSKSSFLLTVLRWMYILLMIPNPALTNIFPKTSMEK